jgi:hypothetical protein
MTIECHVSQCPFHSCHTIVNEGPFCYEPRCRVTEEFIASVEDKSCHDALDAYDVDGNLIGTVTLDDDVDFAALDWDKIHNTRARIKERNAETTRLEKEHLGDPDLKTGIYSDNINKDTRPIKKGYYNADNPPFVERPIDELDDNPKPMMWECRIGTLVTHITNSRAVEVRTLFINAPTLIDVWDVLRNVYGEDRVIRHVSIKRYKL